MAIHDDNKTSVSVVIPAYNAATSIATALDSVLAQTFPDFEIPDCEIIVVNDGSEDTELLEQVLLPYSSHIRYIKQENQGPSAARNRGIVAARCQYVAFLDSDDFWLPQYLAVQLSFLRNDPSLRLVYSDSLLIRNGISLGRTFERESQVLPVTFDALLEERCTVSTSSTVALRQVLIEAGLFDEQLVRCEDFDLWLRMAFRGAPMTHHSQAHVCRTVSGSGLSANGYLMKRARIAVLDKINSSLPLSPAQRELLNKRRRLNEAMSQLDRVKQCMITGEFDKALEDACQAASVLPSWKLRLAVSGLRRAPHLLRAAYQVHKQVLSIRGRRSAASPASMTQASLPPTGTSRPGYTVPGLAALSAGRT